MNVPLERSINVAEGLVGNEGMDACVEKMDAVK